ncbi:MAG: CPBP family intramembrane glutamic endopeptidase [Chthonomonadales bacterium]
MILEISQRARLVLVGILAVLAVLVALVDIGMFIAWAWRKEDVDAGRRPPLFARRWSLADVWIAAQVIVFVLLVLLGGASFVAFRRGAFGPDGSVSPLFLGIALLMQNVLLAGVPWAVIRYRYGLGLRDIGAWPPPRMRVALRAAALGVALVVVGNSAELLFDAVLKAAFPSAASSILAFNKQVTAEGLIGKKMTPALFATMLLGAGVLAPIGEEMFFRGFLYNSSKRRFGVTWGTLISAAAFGVAHAGPVAMPVIFLMGVVLAVAYERTRSLWFTGIMHATNNCIGVAGAYLYVLSHHALR